MSAIGNFAPNIEVVNDELTTSNLFAPRAYYTGEELVEIPAGVDSARVRADVQPSFASFSGAQGLDFGNDWYFRIHFVPTQIDVGNLVSSQSQNIAVWNAFFTPQPYTALQTSGFDGITLTPPSGVTPPTTLNELQFVVYAVSIDLNGPPTIAASVTFSIGGQDYRVPITGRRVVLLPFAPNWADGVEETIAYRSTVARSWDGTEQRRSLRAVPRRRLAYTALLRRRDAQKLDNLLYGWHGRLFAVPLWAEAASLAAPAATGDTVLTFDASNKTFAAGGLLTLWRDGDKNEVREIDSISGTTVTLRSPLTGDWPAGSRAYPSMVSSLATEVQARRLTESIVEVPLVLDGEPSTNIYPVENTLPPSTYQAQELYLHYTDWSEGTEVVWASDRLTVDQGTGQFRNVQRSGYSTPTKSHSWTLKNHEQAFEFRRWLQRREGQTIPFYAPTGYVDFTLAADVALGDTAIDVEDNGYAIFSGAAPLRRDIAVQLKNGTTICRRITATNFNEDGSVRLQLDSAMPSVFGAADVKRISLLGFFRLASDEITLLWRAEGVAQAQAGFTATKT